MSLEFGSYAFLMGADLDFESPEVNDELNTWGRWFMDTTGVDGFRFDAVKHISAPIFPAWLEHMEQHAGKKLFTVAEYWSGNLAELHWFLDAAGTLFTAFDVPLHYNFHVASKAGGNYDMRRLFDGSLVKERPVQAVTFVTNHDSQPLQSLESVVEPWFVPLAYAAILLRRDGYRYLFYPDYYGAEYEDFGHDGNRHKVVLPSHQMLIDIFLKARKECGHGEQVDYFDHWNRIGWVRLGDKDHPKAMAVLMSDGPEGTKWMGTARPAGTKFRDLTRHVEDVVEVNGEGFGEFRCRGWIGIRMGQRAEARRSAASEGAIRLLAMYLLALDRLGGSDALLLTLDAAGLVGRSSQSSGPPSGLNAMVLTAFVCPRKFLPVGRRCRFASCRFTFSTLAIGLCPTR